MMKRLATVAFLLFWSSLKATPLLRRDGADNLPDVSVPEDAAHDRRDDETADLIVDNDVKIEHVNSDTKSNEVEDSDESGSSGIFQSILAQMMKGHVTENSLSRWMAQLRNAMAKGTISSDKVNSFMDTIKEKLTGTSSVDTCCPLG